MQQQQVMIEEYAKRKGISILGQSNEGLAQSINHTSRYTRGFTNKVLSTGLKVIDIHKLREDNSYKNEKSDLIALTFSPHHFTL